MDLFGFDEEQLADDIEILSPGECKINEPLSSDQNHRMSVTEIQLLLSRDVNAKNKSAENSVNENSFCSVDEEIEEEESYLTRSATKRVYTRPVRPKQKVLSDIQNTSFISDLLNTSTMMKRKRTMKRKSIETIDNKNSEIPDAAEKIINHFKEIEEFQLLVE